MNIPRSEVYRYLGYRGHTPDDDVIRLVEDSLTALSAAEPHHILRRLPLTVTDTAVTVGGLRVESAKLCQHLRGCDEGFLFAATLGATADRLIRRGGRLDMSRAVILQASAAAMLEAYCDEVQDALAADLRREGKYLRPRFSPGYSDFPLSFQQPLLDLLEAAKRLSLTLTDGCMLVPTKSVTAIIGITADASRCHTHHCAACDKADCPFRKG